MVGRWWSVEIRENDALMPRENVRMQILLPMQEGAAFEFVRVTSFEGTCVTHELI